MPTRFAHEYIGVVLLGIAAAFVMHVAYADSDEPKDEVVVSLPSSISHILRGRNRGGRGGCPESNIFVHGFGYLGIRLDRTIWFLGAPDYLCETNSFVTVIATSDGKWTLGQASEEDWLGSRMLAGVPIVFLHSNELGYFLTSEWQAEGPANFLYYSKDGETWTSVKLPAAGRKNPNGNCCEAATIRAVCAGGSGKVYLSYYESENSNDRLWSTNVDKTFPERVDWVNVSMLPDYARCGESLLSDFIPHSLREKTSDGVLFEVSLDS